GDRAAAFAAEWEVEHSSTDLAATLEVARPDLVVVCTPPAAHHEGVRASLDAGAWVWCEKPPVLSLAEYDDLADHEPEGGRPAMGHGIHQMDLMLSLLGDWREIRALMGTLDRDVATEDVSIAAV